MHRGVQEEDAFIFVPHALNRGFPTVRATIVHDEKQTLCLLVGRTGQDLVDQVAKRDDPCLGRTTAYDDAPMDVPRCQVLQRSMTLVLRLDTPGSAWTRRRFFMQTLSG